MRKFIFAILAIFFTIICFGQEKHLPIWYDYTITKQTVDSLIKLKVKEVIVVRTDKTINHLCCEDSILTFICWQQNDSFLVRIVTQDKIYKVIPFNGKAIFDFPNKKKTFVTEDEQTLKFCPPLTNQDAVFYFSAIEQGYFEQADKLNGSAITYKAMNQKKENLRKEWFTTIIDTLLKENFNLEIYCIYDRYKEWEHK